MLDRVLPPERLPELLAESDFVVLAAPLTDDTRGLIGEAAIAQLKPGAWVINVARGELVDERALARALREGRLGGAVLDTFREEPLPPTSPLYDLPERDPDAAHLVVVDARARPVRRAVLRQPPALRGGRTAGQRRRPVGGLLSARGPASPRLDAPGPRPRAQSGDADRHRGARRAPARPPSSTR